MVFHKGVLLCVIFYFCVRLGSSKFLHSTSADDLVPEQMDGKKGERVPSKNVFFAAMCECKKDGNGDCINGKCICYPGYGVFEKSSMISSIVTCKECHCGRVAADDGKGRKFGCTIKYIGMLSQEDKKCICDEAGYYDKSGQCSVCDCGKKFDGTLFHCTNSQSCTCGNGYKQVNNKCTATDVCSMTPCLNDGICQNTIDEIGFKCTCKYGFRGQRCEIDNCEDYIRCEENEICDNDGIRMFCKCRKNYEKVNNICILKMDPCTSNPCENEGMCQKLSPIKFSCICPPSHAGKTCETELDPCTSSPCENGGTCQKNSPTKFSCICPPTQAGKTCETELDPCKPSPCVNGGMCQKLSPTKSSCICPPTHAGKTCETELDPCTWNPCRNGGTCQKLNPTKFSCICPPTHAGEMCETELDPCTSSPCENGGTCQKLSPASFKCICPATHAGQMCQTEINPCIWSPCRNGGTCQKLSPTKFSCTCLPTHSGKKCETESEILNKTTTPISTIKEMDNKTSTELSTTTTTEFSGKIFAFRRVHFQKIDYSEEALEIRQGKK